MAATAYIECLDKDNKTIECPPNMKRFLRSSIIPFNYNIACNKTQNALIKKAEEAKFRALYEHDTQSSTSVMPMAIAMAILAVVLFIVHSR